MLTWRADVACTVQIYPPINVLPSLSRLMKVSAQTANLSRLQFAIVVRIQRLWGDTSLSTQALLNCSHHFLPIHACTSMYVCMYVGGPVT